MENWSSELDMVRWSFEVATRVCCLRWLYEVVMKVGFQSMAMIVVNGGRKGSSLKIKRRESCDRVGILYIKLLGQKISWYIIPTQLVSCS